MIRWALDVELVILITAGCVNKCLRCNLEQFNLLSKRFTPQASLDRPLCWLTVGLLYIPAEYVIFVCSDVFMEKHWKSVIPKSICDYFFEAQRKVNSIICIQY